MATQSLTSDCHCDCGDRGWLPLNSKVQVNQDRSITITPPTGWLYVGFKKRTNQLLQTNATTVSCLCSGTGSCFPFIATGPKGSTSGCAGNCTRCVMEQGARIGGVNQKFETGGYINIADPIVDFVDKDLELPAAFAALFDLPEARKGLKEFITKTYRGLPLPNLIKGDNFISAPDGYSLTVVNVLGRATIIAVPTVSLTERAVGGGTASCSCSQGTCTLKTVSVPLIGSVTYCEGSCTGTCTLSAARIIGNGAEDILYSAKSYRF